jgi:predicted lipoprotein with Yx(FWY)xxD motif
VTGPDNILSPAAQPAPPRGEEHTAILAALPVLAEAPAPRKRNEQNAANVGFAAASDRPTIIRGRIAMKRIALGVAAILMTTGLGLAAEPAMVTKTPKGSVFTDAEGMTLYTFDKDKAGKSTCYDRCATNWPAFKAGAKAKAEGKWTVVDRADGTKMWAYDGKPLYTYARDKKAGDMAGDGVGGVWHAAKAD